MRTTPGPGVLRALVTRTLSALAAASSPVRSSTLSVMSLSTRPNEEALVMSRVTPPAVIVHRYSAWVWAETMTLIDGSSRAAMSAIGLPVRLPAQPLSAAPDDWKPPWWMTRTEVLTPWLCSLATARLAASASSWNVRPATPVGVTIVGVSFSTSPMKPTLNFLLPRSVRNSLVPKAGNSVLPVASTTTLADRYLKSAPGKTLVVLPLASAYGAAVHPSGTLQPPFWMRSSSWLPLSNSWLPTDPKSTCMRLVATVIGSSKKRPLASGLAPMLSPANTVASWLP